MRAEDRYKLRKGRWAKGPNTPGFWSVLGPELLHNARTAQFWLSIARNSVPLFGVFLWKWDVLEMSFYFLLQCWLMGSLYCAIDMTFNPEKGPPPRDTLDGMQPMLQKLFVAGLVFAVLVGIFGGFMLIGFFRKNELSEFFSTGWQQWSFLKGVLALTAGCIAEAVRFLRSLPERTPADIEADNYRFAATLQTVALLCVFATFLGAISRFLFGPAAVVVPMVLVATLFDATPRSTAALLGTRKPEASADAGRPT